MTQEMQFKKIIAQYCDVKPEEMTNDMKFREDLGFSSLDFMSFLGEIEDTFDIELEGCHQCSGGTGKICIFFTEDESKKCKGGRLI